ncbi:unnamed protein product, partial [Amoebophrya sp. A25]
GPALKELRRKEKLETAKADRSRFCQFVLLEKVFLRRAIKGHSEVSKKVKASHSYLLHYSEKGGISCAYWSKKELTSAIGRTEPTVFLNRLMKSLIIYGT